MEKIHKNFITFLDRIFCYDKNLKKKREIVESELTYLCEYHCSMEGDMDHGTYHRSKYR